MTTDLNIPESVALERRVPTVDEYRLLRERVGWPNGDSNAQSLGLKNSLYSVCLLYGDEIIGCGRVIGDRGNYFYIQDIIVLPEHQKQGLGMLIMDALMEYIKNNAKPGSMIALMAAKGVARFYKRYGFAIREADSPGMCFTVE